MKKIFSIFVLVLLSAFVLTGCSEETVVEQTKPDKEETQQSTKEQETEDSSQGDVTADDFATPDISALKEDGLNCLSPGVRVCLPVNYAKTEVGDTVGFAFGVMNQFPDTKKYAIRLRFVETQQSLGEISIETDKDYMKKWLNVNDLETYYELESGEKLSKPIQVKIRDSIAEGKSTEKGAYVFEAQAETFEDGFYKEYGGAQQFTVRVE